MDHSKCSYLNSEPKWQLPGQKKNILKGLEAKFPHEALKGLSVCEVRLPNILITFGSNIQSPEQAASQCLPFLYSPL